MDQTFNNSQHLGSASFEMHQQEPKTRPLFANDDELDSVDHRAHGVVEEGNDEYDDEDSKSGTMKNIYRKLIKNQPCRLSKVFKVNDLPANLKVKFPDEGLLEKLSIEQVEPLEFIYHQAETDSTSFLNHLQIKVAGYESPIIGYQPNKRRLPLNKRLLIDKKLAFQSGSASLAQLSVAESGYGEDPGARFGNSKKLEPKVVPPQTTNIAGKICEI